jgi:cellulose synthase/poly-beta-1,6-N-acetylglucosamine synthase-like glycosyltransferase
MIVIHIFTILLFVYLLSTIPYLFILAVAGRFGRLKTYTTHPRKARIAVIIPSYKEDNIILETTAHALAHDYPAEYFTVTVIADHLNKTTIDRLRSLPVRLLEVNWEKSMKAKSLNAALSALAGDQYDLAFILDADNLMSPGCLEKVNHAFQTGWIAIQCHRSAKNRNTSIAVLDAMSEEINNTIFRRGQRALGLSCALIGSGMAFEFHLLREIFASPAIQDNPGEDKEVEVRLISKGLRVEYIEDAYVYDEKVQRKEVFQRQRTRWLATQFENIQPLLSKEMRRDAIKSVYLHKIFEWLLLPRLLIMLLISLLLLLCGIDAWTGTHILSPAWPWWTIPAILYALTLATAIPSSFYNSRTLAALLQVPTLILAMLKALLGIRKNKGGFLHTPKEFSG